MLDGFVTLVLAEGQPLANIVLKQGTTLPFPQPYLWKALSPRGSEAVGSLTWPFLCQQYTFTQDFICSQQGLQEVHSSILLLFTCILRHPSLVLVS